MAINKDKLAEYISKVLYPGITGAAFTYIMFLGIMGVNTKAFLTASVYAGLIALSPYLIVKHLVKLGKISDRSISVKEERRIFFNSSLPTYVTAFIFLFIAGVPKLILLMGIGLMALVIIYYFISPVYKISIHVGGLAFDIVAISLVVNQKFSYLLPLIPLLAWSRYHLGKHTLGQSFLGTLIGIGIPLLLFKLFI